MMKNNPFSIDNLLTRWLPFPKAIIIEPINVCQLNCPLCPTGLQKLNYAPMAMTFETFKVILAKVPFVKAIDLHRAGESFLNPEILDMIRRASEKKIHVVISSNFSVVRPDEFFSGIVESGLGRLIVSLDGASKDSYDKYRYGGDFDLVVANIKKLQAAKKQARSNKPEIIWQFLVSRFNEHEINTAKEMAKELEVTLDLRPLDMSDNLVDVELDATLAERKDYWLAKDRRYICPQYKGAERSPVFQGICSELFTKIAITVDGKILPCCGTWDKNSVFGDLMRDSFKEIWTNQKYVNSRLRFFKKDFNPEIKSICFQCKNFGTSPSLKDKMNLLIEIHRRNLGHFKIISVIKKFFQH